MTLPFFIGPVIWLLIELVLMAGLFIGLFRMRRSLGLTPFLMMLGGLQYLQVVLAMSVYVEVRPGMLVSPGSTVLFVSTLFAIMLMYIRAGAAEARRLIYGVLVANLGISVITPLFGLQLGGEHAVNLLDVPTELFFQNPRLLLAGTLALVVDVLLIIVLYEKMNRWMPRRQFLSIWLTISAVVVTDSLLFSVGAFAGTDAFGLVLWSGLVGKLNSGTAFSAILYFYLRHTRSVDELPAPTEYQDIFHRLSFRRRYEMTLELVRKDALTGLLNRGAFDAVMERRLGGSSTDETALLLIDVDHFKSVNDTHGHAVGDAGLASVRADSGRLCSGRGCVSRRRRRVRCCDGERGPERSDPARGAHSRCARC